MQRIEDVRATGPRKRGDRADVVLELDIPRQIPEGEYIVTTSRGRKITRFGRHVYELPCTVREHPEYAGVVLTHYLGLPEWRPRARRYAPVSSRTKLAQEVYIALGGRWPSRRDNMSPSVLEQGQYRARVVVPAVDYRGHEVPLPFRVSVVADLLERLA